MTTVTVLDIETTGMDPGQGAEVIELGWQHVQDTENGWFFAGKGDKLFGCERPSPPEVLAVHHITPELIEGLPLYTPALAAVAMDLSAPGPIEYYVAHNQEFEYSFLHGLTDPQFSSPAPRWICTYKCALVAWPDAPSHGNQALMYYRSLHHMISYDERMPPHRALPDAVVTARIFVSLRATGMSLEDMVRITSEPANLPTCPIGKERGKKWADIDSGFLSWCLRQPDMRPDVVHCARRELERRRTAYHRGD